MSLEELILTHAAGMPVSSFERSGDAVGVMMIPIPSEGILTGVTGIAAAESVEGVTGLEISARLNYPIKPLPEGSSYLGFIFARDDTPAGVEASLRAAHQRLHFDIRRTLSLRASGS